MNDTASDPGPAAIRRALSSAGLDASLEEEMKGGASTRRFFRLRRPDGRTLLGMYVPQPPEAMAQAKQTGGSAPFVELASLLRAKGLRVPEIYADLPEHEALLVEDLGDATLEAYLKQHPAAAEHLYQSAVTDLARAQQELSPVPAESSITTRSFDQALLLWEALHFKDWILEADGKNLSPQDAQIFQEAAEHLAGTISGWDYGYTHRDYQSRNLMVRGEPGQEHLTWIDFQDSMMGPRVYDLVALLIDSYQSFDRAFIDARLDDYCVARGLESERERIGYEFDFVTIQRKLKDAGRFVYMAKERGNSSFLPYVESSIRRARDALGRIDGEPQLSALATMLERLL